MAVGRRSGASVKERQKCMRRQEVSSLVRLFWGRLQPSSRAYLLNEQPTEIGERTYQESHQRPYTTTVNSRSSARP